MTNVWAEKVNDKVSYKFRFEKIDLTTKSWWAPEGSPLLTSDRDFSQKAQVVCCGMCLNDSKKIFEQGWMCLSPDCVVFWKLDGQDPSANLSYSKEFLQERTQWPEMIKPPFDLKPVPLADNFGNPFSYSNWKGMVCPNCGRCNTRNLWTRWQCRAVGCGFEHGGTTVPVPISAVLPDYEGNDGGHALPQDEHSAPVVLRDPVFLGFWRIHIYDLLKGNKIAHFHSNCKINQEADGPNAMFRSLQEADINLKRFPLQSAQGNLLSFIFIQFS